jgi:hypothetical protein
MVSKSGILKPKIKYDDFVLNNALAFLPSNHLLVLPFLPSNHLLI